MLDRQAHGGKLVINKLCEDCGSKQAAFGFEKEKKTRWCFLGIGRAVALRYRPSTSYQICEYNRCLLL